MVFGLADRRIQDQMNRTIYHAVHLLEQEQKKIQTGTPMEMTGHYEIKTNERGILSLQLTNYAYSTPMAHGFTAVKSLTYDVNTGKLYALQDLFKPGSNYSAVLSGIVAAQIKQRGIPLLHGNPVIGPETDYYLADKALVIYFPLYAIAPYYYGFPMFPISVYDLMSIAAEQGPLDTLAADVV
ncbi:RsiV family protein [Paenibacillus sp. P26]|nr:RsiV family protein [Paenibacillus sp. P26]